MKTQISFLALCALLSTACDPDDGVGTDTDSGDTDTPAETSGGPVEIDADCAQILQANIRVGFEYEPDDIGAAQAYSRSVALATCQGQGFTLCTTVVMERSCVEVSPTDSCEWVGSAPEQTIFTPTINWAPMGPSVDAVSWRVETFALGADPDSATPLDSVESLSSPALPMVCQDGECDFALDPMTLEGLGC